MNKIIVLAFALFVAGCGDSVTDGKVTLEGEADLNVQENFASCEIQQVGSNYLVRQNGGVDPYAMALDPSIVYAPGEWIELVDADALRVSPLTPEEESALQ